MIYLIVTTAIIAAAAMIVIVNYNTLVKCRQRVKNAESQIDVQLQRRFDLMTNMTEIVREYAKHESGIFEKTAELRAQWMRAETLDEKYDIKEKADKSLKGIIAIAEGYPELKADKNYLALQETLKDSESKTAFARQFYNDTVTIYNIKTEMFPSNIFAKLFGFDCEQLFEAKNLREEK